MSKKQHYHLVSGKVIFQRNKDSELEQLELNTMIQTDQPYFTAKNIARAQQALQMLIFQKIGVVQITDVFIISVSRLGLMTEKEFTSGLDELQAEMEAGSGHV